MKQNIASGSLLVVGLVLATFCLAVGEAVVCTPATCNGPVRLEFSESDCSGEPTFVELGLEFGVCDDGDIYEMDEDGLYHFNYDGTQPCNRTAAGASYEIDFRRWGACWHEGSVPVRRSQFSSSTTMGTSVLYLASVNDSYVSPQTFDNQPLPAYQKLNTDCFSIDNCTLSNDQPSQDWNTGYLSANCQTPMYTITNPKEELGVCYNFYNQTYFRSGCFDEKGSYAGYFSDALCTNPIRVIAYRYSCTGSRIENHCTAPITPLPVTSTQQPTQAPSPGAPTTPDSSASISGLSPLLTTIALIAAASLFF
jgi:hypothetical protein